jgi:hypothetical protein
MQTLELLFLQIPILRRFRIIRCNRQAALHSGLFNYTPLVLGGTDKNKQLAIIKPTQTGINRNKKDPHYSHFFTTAKKNTTLAL